MLAEVVYCPACWGPGQLRMDKHGKPYLRCGSGCRIFTNGPDAIGALTVISEWISSSLKRMEADAAYREAMRGVVTQHRRSLRAALATPSSPPADAVKNENVA